MAVCSRAQYYSIGCAGSEEWVPPDKKRWGTLHAQCLRKADYALRPDDDNLKILFGTEGYLVPGWRELNNGTASLCSRHYYWIKTFKPLLWGAAAAAAVYLGHKAYADYKQHTTDGKVGLTDWAQTKAKNIKSRAENLWYGGVDQKRLALHQNKIDSIKRQISNACAEGAPVTEAALAVCATTNPIVGKLKERLERLKGLTPGLKIRLLSDKTLQKSIKRIETRRDLLNLEARLLDDNDLKKSTTRVKEFVKLKKQLKGKSKEEIAKIKTKLDNLKIGDDDFIKAEEVKRRAAAVRKAAAAAAAGESSGLTQDVSLSDQEKKDQIAKIKTKLDKLNKLNIKKRDRERAREARRRRLMPHYAQRERRKVEEKAYAETPEGIVAAKRLKERKKLAFCLKNPEKCTGAAKAAADEIRVKQDTRRAERVQKRKIRRERLSGAVRGDEIKAGVPADLDKHGFMMSPAACDDAPNMIWDPNTSTCLPVGVGDRYAAVSSIKRVPTEKNRQDWKEEHIRQTNEHIRRRDQARVACAEKNTTKKSERMVIWTKYGGKYPGYIEEFYWDGNQCRKWGKAEPPPTPTPWRPF